MKEKILIFIWFPFYLFGMFLAPFIVLFMWLFMWKSLKEINEFWKKLNSNNKINEKENC